MATYCAGPGADVSELMEETKSEPWSHLEPSGAIWSHVESWKPKVSGWSSKWVVPQVRVRVPGLWLCMGRRRDGMARVDFDLSVEAEQTSSSQASAALSLPLGLAAEDLHMAS